MPHEPTLEFTLLGRPALHVVQQDATRFEIVLPTKKALALLAYLALNGATARAALAGLLWGDSTDAEARKNLRQDVYRLQGTSVGAWLEAGRHHLALRGAVRVDALELREAAALGNLERVAGLSKGVLLEGLGLPGAAEFETWLDAEREAFARLHRDSLGAVAAHLERRGDLRAAITTLERVVQFDPLQETPQRELMRLHWQLGERAEALARLSRLKLLLREELGLDPSAETLALEARIRGNVTKPACTELEDQLEVQRHALEHLRMARTLHAENAGTERVAFHLERALRPLERTLTRLLELRHAPLPQAAD